MTKLDLGNANNEKIDDLNLIALRKYACAKVNGQKDWYLKCIDCDACQVGKRVKDILDGETRPEISQTERFEKRLDKTIDMRIEEAMKHPDPKQWLVDQGYYSNTDSAQAQINKWKRRTSAISYSNDISKAVEARKKHLTDKIISIFDNAKDEKEAAIRYLQTQNPNSKISSVFATPYDWCKKRPDLYARFPVMFKVPTVFNRKPYKDKTVKEALAMLMEKPENDEVSVDDFLQETENTGEEKAEPAVEITESSIRVTPKGPEPQMVLRSEFGRKKQELRKRRDYISFQIADLKGQLEKIEENMLALDKAAELFGMKPTIILNASEG